MNINFRSGGIANPPHRQDEVDSFIIELSDGTPVLAGFEMEGRLIVSKGGDPDFPKMLSTLRYQGKPPVVSVVDYPSG